MKKVVVAPLDWGLGHATRCIPVIEQLQKKNYEVVIASSGSALALLRKEFPELKFFALPSYRIRYPKRGSFILSIISQIPKISNAINQEHKRIQKIVRENKIDLIISDNRYGCWSKEVNSIFIGHQLNVQLPSGWKVFKSLVDWFHLRKIRKFNQCWVPDDPKIDLTGELSKADISIRRIGILSRFERKETQPKYDIVFVLSGPEPQRSVFEEIVVKQTANTPMSIMIVRGVIEGHGNWNQLGNVTTVNFLSSNKLEEIINQSKLVIARSGYSTIMDLTRLGKKAVFVPTPGQTEQEYLGKRLMREKIALCMSQDKFELATAISLSDSYLGFVESKTDELLTKTIESL